LEPEATLPFDVLANDVTESECPFNVNNNLPLFGSHTLTEQSSELETKYPFIGNEINALTGFVCPLNVKTNSPVQIFHILIV